MGSWVSTCGFTPFVRPFGRLPPLFTCSKDPRSSDTSVAGVMGSSSSTTAPPPPPPPAPAPPSNVASARTARAVGACPGATRRQGQPCRTQRARETSGRQSAGAVRRKASASCVAVALWLPAWEGRGRRTGPTRRALGVRVISGAACARRRARGWSLERADATAVVAGRGGSRPWAWNVYFWGCVGGC
jgi:hypothetical protein